MYYLIKCKFSDFSYTGCTVVTTDPKIFVSSHMFLEGHRNKVVNKEKTVF